MQDKAQKLMWQIHSLLKIRSAAPSPWEKELEDEVSSADRTLNGASQEKLNQGSKAGTIQIKFIDDSRL